MVLLIGLGIFLLCTIGKAIAQDWVTGQQNLQWCSSQIADAIYSGSNCIADSIEQSARYFTEDERELIEKYKDKQIETYTDSHGRKMRTRIVYNEHGIPIAEERIVIEE
jgi:hypothetical protein